MSLQANTASLSINKNDNEKFLKKHEMARFYHGSTQVCCSSAERNQARAV